MKHKLTLTGTVQTYTYTCENGHKYSYPEEQGMNIIIDCVSCQDEERHVRIKEREVRIKKYFKSANFIKVNSCLNCTYFHFDRSYDDDELELACKLSVVEYDEWYELPGHSSYNNSITNASCICDNWDDKLNEN